MTCKYFVFLELAILRTWLLATSAWLCTPALLVQVSLLGAQGWDPCLGLDTEDFL